MSERRFERSMSDQESIRRELKDWNITSPDEYKDVSNNEEGNAQEKFEAADLASFTKIFSYIEGEGQSSDPVKKEKFRNTNDSIERLEVLRTMGLREAAESIRDYGLTDAGYRYLTGRLTFYQKLIEGKATRRYKTQEYDSKKGEYVDVMREEPIDASNATPETIKLGLLRDSMFASMIGTPEMGIYKIAKQKCEEGKIKTTHFPLLKGYHSGIHESSIGYAYPLLRKTYSQARAVVEGKLKDKQHTEEETEHRAVLLASQWLADSMNYNDSGRSPHSPYASSNEEALMWARLGPNVQRQFRGMRHKINGVDLHNIHRFIGKAGDGKYDSERKRVFGQIKFLKEESNSEKKQEFTNQQNEFEIEQQERRYQDETERLNQGFEKSKAELASTNLPEDERELQLQGVINRHQNALLVLQQNKESQVNRITRRHQPTEDEIRQLHEDFEQRMTSLENDYRARVVEGQAQDENFTLEKEYQREGSKLNDWFEQQKQHLYYRTPDELLVDLEQRQVVVNQRHENTKSLAQKALDLHFRFNQAKKISRGEYEERAFPGVVDWINNAPFGTIKRVHRALQRGVSEQTAMMLALAEIYGDKEKGVSRADLDVAVFARNLAKAGHGAQVAENFEKLVGVQESDHQNIADELIKANAGDAVVRNFEKFTGISSDQHEDMAMNLIRAGASRTVVENFEKFTGITPEDHRAIIFECLKSGSGYEVAQSFEKFSGVQESDHLEIVMGIIKNGGGYQVAYNLEKFKGLKDADHRDIVMELIKAGNGNYLRNDDVLKKFKGLEASLRAVIKAGKYEALPKVLEAGFTVEEITRFPYLISPLIAKQ